MTDILRLFRVHNLMIAAAGVLAGGWIALGRLATPAPLLWAVLAGVGLGAAGYAVNDLSDAAADRVNRPAPERPLAGERLTARAAATSAGLAAAAGLTAAGFAGAGPFALGVGALAVMLVYSPVLKRRGFVGNVAVALLAGLPLFYGALAVRRPAEGLVPWALGAWIHLVRELVKDLEDEPGDRAIGRRTLPITIGSKAAAALAAGVSLGFIPASLALPYRAGYGGAYFVVALLAQLAVLLAASRLIVGKIERVSLLLKGAMLVGLVALVAGRLG